MQSLKSFERIKAKTMQRKSPGREGDECLSAPAIREKLKKFLQKTGNKSETNLNNVSPRGDDLITCTQCKQPIEGVIVEALGETWHQKHFTCTACKQPITAKRFNVHEGKAYCDEDYSTYFLKKCAYCKQPIADVVISALNKNWHKQHFKCISCKMVLSDSIFFEKEDCPFCQLCYEQKYLPKCQECQKPIQDTALVVLGDRWHQSCFKCQVCGVKVTDSAFELMHNRPTCLSCNS